MNKKPKKTKKTTNVRQTGEHLFADCGGLPRCTTCGADEDVAFTAGEECTFVQSKIPIQETQFVLASDLFKGLRKLWEQLVDSNPNFTWGSNNRSMVTAETLLDHLEDCTNVNERSVSELDKRCQDLPEGLQCYIDLEN